MKARFMQQQPPVKIIQKDGIAYVYICQSETQGTETYPDMGEWQITESYYEYDYNEIIAPAVDLPLDDIQAHPENYLSYKYTHSSDDSGAKALEEVEKLKAAIERGLTV